MQLQDLKLTMNNIVYNTVSQILEGYASKGIRRWVRDLHKILLIEIILVPNQYDQIHQIKCWHASNLVHVLLVSLPVQTGNFTGNSTVKSSRLKA